MISFNSENDFVLNNSEELANWISAVILEEGHREGELNYIFCDDDYLLQINQKYLSHDTYTDIISFDYTVGKELHGDIFISTERVKENSKEYNVVFQNELKRVMVHGVLHFCGYKDKSEKDRIKMRSKEDFYINQFC